MSKVRVSVIVPVHNAELYLGECLDSIIAQTETDLEIICVDDGSTDSSASLLDEYAEHDQRIRVLHQICQGAGAARNTGLKVARGTYLSFLDADDFFEPEMLMESSDKMDATNADIVVFGSWIYDTIRKTNRQAHWNLRVDNLPDKDPFSYRDIPDCVFNTFGNYTWNKLFRRSFVEESEIRFQEISRTNDLLFVCSALILASQITVLQKAFVHYRVASNTSLQATNDRDPLSFFNAFCCLQDFLISKGVYEDVEKSFLEHALDGVVANVESLHSLGGLLQLRSDIREKIEPRFGFLAKNQTLFENVSQLNQYRNLYSLEPLDYLFNRATELRTEREDLYWYVDWDEWRIWKLESQVKETEKALDSARQELAKAEHQAELLRDSFSYRLGRKLTAPVRLIRESHKE